MAHIIFDFDGTLADSLPVLVDEYTRWSGQSEPLSADDQARMRNMTAVQVLKELKIPLYKVPGLLVRGRDALRYRINEVDLFLGMDEVVKHASKDNSLYIMSSNSTMNIQAFLKRYKLSGYFADVKAGISVFGKAQHMRVFLKRRSIDRDDCYYIGDEIRDIEAAKRAKLRIISVTWGYNGEKILKKYRPDYLVTEPRQITEIVAGNL